MEFSAFVTGQCQRISKRIKFRTFKYCTLLLFFINTFFSLAAQDKVPVDTAVNNVESVLRRAQKIMHDGALKSKKDFDYKRNQLKQQKLLTELERNTLKVKAYLTHKLDTNSVTDDLHSIFQWSAISTQGIFVQGERFNSYRNLVTTSKLQNELLNRITAIRAKLEEQEVQLMNFRYLSDSLNAEPAIYELPEDSLSLMEFLHKYQYIAQGLKPIDSNLTAALSGIHQLQARVNYLLYEINADVQELDIIQKEVSHNFLTRHFPDFLGEVSYENSFEQTIELSKQKTALLLMFYLEHHAARFFVLLLLIAASFYFLYSLKRIHHLSRISAQDLSGKLVLRYPVLTAVFLVLNLFQFIFPDPPFILNFICWLTNAILLAVIFNCFISKFWMRFWVFTTLLFTLSELNNLILQSSQTERIIVLILSSAGVLFSLYILLSGKHKDLKERLIIVFIVLQLFMEATAVVANITGRFNLAKALYVCGYCNVIIGVSFLWTIRLINEGLTLAAEVYTRQSAQLFYVNFNKVGNRAPKLLYLLLIVGWFILLGRNFYEFKLISEPLKEFFVADRTIGEFTFSISKILIFFGIMILAVIASRITSFFAADKSHTNIGDKDTRRAGLGSWLLLVRVIIISAGLFLALAASGFPLDRITILIGALGVGVGLGLQSIVNNLVSGLIIAFDRPVNVGDFIEVSGHTGAVKSIGFRSSVIASSGGADVIIPNGDLLNAHLINWTLGGNKKQIEINVNIAYETDLKKAGLLLNRLLEENKDILTYPPPVVLFDTFGTSAISTKVLFWVRDYREAAVTKSRLMVDITLLLKENNIEIPFPQQDIHIRNNSDSEKMPEEKG